MQPQISSIRPTDFPSRTILVVDDDAYFLAWLTTYLEGEGFNILKAKDSYEALLACRRQNGPIHLLLSDLLLAPRTLQLQGGSPGWSKKHGVELATEIEELCPGIRVILMSGHADQELQALKINREGRLFLRKPFRLDTLLWTVHTALDGHPPI